MTEARKSARDAAQEVIEQTEIAISDLRKSLYDRAWEAAYQYASDTPVEYRDMRLSKHCDIIATEVIDELLGGKQ